MGIFVIFNPLRCAQSQSWGEFSVLTFFGLILLKTLNYVYYDANISKHFYATKTLNFVYFNIHILNSLSLHYFYYDINTLNFFCTLKPKTCIKMTNITLIIVSSKTTIKNLMEQLARTTIGKPN